MRGRAIERIKEIEMGEIDRQDEIDRREKRDRERVRETE